MCLRSLGSGFDHCPVTKNITIPDTKLTAFEATELATPTSVMRKVVFIMETLDFLSVTPAQWSLAGKVPSSVRNAVKASANCVNIKHSQSCFRQQVNLDTFGKRRKVAN